MIFLFVEKGLQACIISCLKACRHAGGPPITWQTKMPKVSQNFGCTWWSAFVCWRGACFLAGIPKGWMPLGIFQAIIYIYTAFNREGVDTYIASHIGHLIQRSLKQRSFQRVGVPPVTQERFPRRAPLLQEGRVPRRAPYFLSISSPEGFLIGPLQCQKREHIGHMQVKKKGHRFIFLLVVRKRACRD